MPLVVLTSTKAIWDDEKKAPWPGVTAALEQLSEIDVVVMVVSNNPEPNWFKPHFGKLMFQKFTKRQGGGIVEALVDANKERHPNLGLSSFVVLAGCQEDMLMAAQERVLLLRSGWLAITSEGWQKYGVLVKQPDHLVQMVPLLAGDDPWFFRGRGTRYQLWALTNAGTHYQGAEHTSLANTLRDYLKEQSEVLSGFQLHLLSSVYREPALLDGKKTIWGYYPSSAVLSDSDHLMSQIVHLVREPLTNRLAKRGEPLFLRHQATLARHTSSSDREDPTNQLLTCHLNPYYRKHIGEGRRIVLLDDYVTYGLSFGVAAALLARAGAGDILCVAMGKFGNCALDFKIEVTGNPFRPLKKGDFKFDGTSPLTGIRSHGAQLEVLKKFCDTKLW